MDNNDIKDLIVIKYIMIDIEITIENKNSQQKECIICLEEFIDNDYIELPNENSLCECKYKIHDKCLEKCDRKCPICKTNIKLNEKPEEDISDEDKKYCGIEKKCFDYIIAYGSCFGLLLFISILTICIYFVKN